MSLSHSRGRCTTTPRMAMGTRETDQPQLWIVASDLTASPRHPFYPRLNAILDAHGFDRFVEERCRRSPPGSWAVQVWRAASISGCCSSGTSKASTPSVASHRVPPIGWPSAVLLRQRDHGPEAGHYNRRR
jgi:hypothetical protein